MNTKGNYGVVFDFDGTWTHKSIGALYKIVDAHALPDEAEEAMIALRDTYLPKIRDGTIRPIDELYWLTETFEIYIRYDLTLDDWQEALWEVKLRPGVAGCLQELHRRDVRVGVVSYGCADFIEYVLRQNGVAGFVDSVMATRLVHDGCDRVVGYDRTTLVYPDNKDVWSRRFAEAYGISPRRLLAVGDSKGDRKLGLHQAPQLAIAKDEEQRQQFAGLFRHIVVIPEDPGDFTPAAEWLGLWLKE